MPDPQPIVHRKGLAATLLFTSDETVSGWAIRYRQWDANGSLQWTKTVGAGVTLGTTTYTVDLAAGGESKGLAATYQGSYLVDRTDAGGEGPLAFGSYSIGPVPPPAF